jgi:16S rRNA (guanine966-N2)-methyltransferase
MQDNRVRIIGGKWRRRTLRFPTVEGLRPTPDRVRETLFNWLGQDLGGKTCLDPFAGSGALCFEALSRGASRVVGIEHNRSALRSLEQNAALLNAAGFELHGADALQFLRRESRVFDVIFLDPPFAAGLAPALWQSVASRLAPEGVVYVESPEPLPALPGWEIWRQGKAGKVHYHLLRRATLQGEAT